MSEYRTIVIWVRDGADFIDNRYTRGHRWLFERFETMRWAATDLRLAAELSETWQRP